MEIQDNELGDWVTIKWPHFDVSQNERKEQRQERKAEKYRNEKMKDGKK
jgi:hypothetical protein